MPGPHIVRRDGRQGLGKAAHRQTVAPLAERRRERELEGIAEHVVRHLIGFGGHELTLGRDVLVAQVRVEENGVQQRGRLAQVLRPGRKRRSPASRRPSW